MLSGCGNVDEPAPATAGITASATSAETTTAAEEIVTTAAERTTEAPAAPPDVVLTSAEKPTAADGKKPELRDIGLRASERELTGGEPADVIWSAEIPADCSPDVVYLIDEDTYETVAALCDIADNANYGGDIMGDCVYNCRFAPDTNIDTDPDVSEKKTYRYFAMFTDDKGTHRSDTFEITVYEPFTDKELNEMEAVRNAIKQLMESEEFRALDHEKKYERVIALLTELSEKGTEDLPYPLITPGCIVSDDDHDMISYQHICGITAGIKIKPFDPRYN